VQNIVELGEGGGAVGVVAGPIFLAI